ncbi:MBL fold metallo-hydrolase [Cellulomonas sp. P5_C6]
MIHPIPMTLHIPAGMAGPEAVELDVRAFLVEHPDGFALIDTGMAAEPDAIRSRLDELGAAWSDVTDVLLTHHHPDHTGGLARIRELAPAATVWASPLDDYVGPVSSVSDGDTVRGLRVLALPGHTPGHLGLVHVADGAVFAGDAVGVADGRLVPAPEQFTADAARAAQSVRRLAEHVGSRVLFSHGPEIDDPAGALRDLIARTG